jgi:hypothetical protein
MKNDIKKWIRVVLENKKVDINSASELEQIAAVKRDASAIQSIKNPGEQVQLAAVKQNGYAIQYIKNPSEQVQLAAVKQNGYAIQYIKNPSEQVQLAAIKQDVYAIVYIKNPSERVQLAAVKENIYAIVYIKNPSLSVLNQCKHEIIKSILIWFKNENISAISKLLQKVAKTNWPELEIIKKSLDYESKRHNGLT